MNATRPGGGPGETIIGGATYSPRRELRRNSPPPQRLLLLPFALVALAVAVAAAAALLPIPRPTAGAAAFGHRSPPPPTTLPPSLPPSSSSPPIPRPVPRLLVGPTLALPSRRRRPRSTTTVATGRGTWRGMAPPPDDVVVAAAPAVPPTARAASSTSTTADATTRTVADLGVSAVPSTSPSPSPSVRPLSDRARVLFESTFPRSPPDDDAARSRVVAASHAPGRVNLIGEHVDYTGGYVFPMAINVGTACYGRGSVVPSSPSPDGAGDGPPASVSCRLASDMFPDRPVVSIASTAADELAPFDSDSPNRWANYVLGVVREYLPDVPDGHTLTFDLAAAGDVPLGGGLSSSASLEVAVATFLEALLGPRRAYGGSGSTATNPNPPLTEKQVKIERALRAQRAERNFAGTPCGIMDQFVSSAAEPGCVLLIDCRSVDYEGYRMGGGGEDDVKIVICNSMVKHDNAGGEYPKRVEQCAEATAALRQFHPDIDSLRDATLSDVEEASDSMDDVAYRRARHVVTENERTVRAAEAWRDGDFDTVGMLMDESHVSMRDDYEVSCEEIDVLVELARSYPGGGVYGSRLTGGGFGGCTVTLVKSEAVDGLVRHLERGYRDRFPDVEGGCVCFETGPEDGARVIAV